MAKIHDSGSNYQFYDKKINPDIKRSAFDLSRIRQTTLDLGTLSPVLRLQYMPNSDIDISFESLVRAVNVPVVPLGSRQRLFYHLYKVDYAQMWPKWGTFMSKGRSGNSVIPLPRILYFIDNQFVSGCLADAFPDFVRGTTVTPNSPSSVYMPYISRVLSAIGIGYNSLANFLGFPPPASLIIKLRSFLSDPDYDFDSFSCYFPAFPFFAYLSIFRSYYLNPNLLNSQFLSLWFPDSEDDWKLVDPDFVNDEVWFYSTYCRSQYIRKIGSNGITSSPSRYCSLNVTTGLRYRNFADDYFTASLFYPMRGDIPELPIDGVIQSLSIPSPDFSLSLTNSDSDIDVDINKLSISDATTSGVLPGSKVNFSQFLAETSQYLPISSTFNGELKVAPQTLNDVAIQFASGYTWEMIRNLSISTIIQEKMARTDGSYIEFVRTFFDQYPSKFADNRPQYIGGDLLPIVYTEVLQSSEDGNTPLGTVGGKGISNGNGFLGKVHCDDFGLVLGIVSILPDTYYSQGWQRQDMYEVQEDFPLPERAELGMQGIYNGEIYYQGTEEDSGLFGYISRYDEWRYAPNEITGKVSDPSSLSFFPYTQSRYFYTLPVLSESFVNTRNNIRKDYLSVADEVPFYAQFAHRIKVVQPLPYKAVPVGLK